MGSPTPHFTHSIDDSAAAEVVTKGPVLPTQLRTHTLAHGSPDSTSIMHPSQAQQPPSPEPCSPRHWFNEDLTKPKAVIISASFYPQSTTQYPHEQTPGTCQPSQQGLRDSGDSEHGSPNRCAQPYTESHPQDSRLPQERPPFLGLVTWHRALSPPALGRGNGERGGNPLTSPQVCPNHRLREDWQVQPDVLGTHDSQWQ